MRDLVAELLTTEACVNSLAQAQGNWWTAHHNDRHDGCDDFVALKGELLERYWQLGGTALQVGDLIDSKGNARSPEEVAANTQLAAIALQQVEFPSGYILGLGRSNGDYGLADETHVYEEVSPGTPGRPMCYRGWNRDFGTSYSIFRGSVGDIGICPICLARIEMGMPPAEAATEPEGLQDLPPDLALWNADYSPLPIGFPLIVEELHARDFDLILP